LNCKNRNRLISFVLFLCLFLLFNNLSSPQSAGELFQKALYQEEAQGDLEKAIEIYKKILERFPDLREVAAKAQLHIGLCYEKLGFKEAQQAFEKVVANYPDQKETVKVARQKLALLMKAKAVIEGRDKELMMRKVFTGHPRDFVGAPSPDGQYLSTVDWKTGDLAVKEIPSGKLHRLTHRDTSKKTYEYALVSIWSPDGKKVAYSWFNEEQFFELRIIDLDEPEPRTLYQNREKFLVLPYDWSPDGLHILVGLGKQQRATQIATISVLDGSVKILKECLINGGLYSTDGNFIIYNFVLPDPETRGSDISLIPIQGGEEIPLVNHPAHDFSFMWDSNGERLLFMSDRTGIMSIWALDMKGGEPQGEPYLLKKDIGRISPLGFTNDGSLYYTIYTGMEDVFIATLDLEKNSVLAPPQKVERLFIGANLSPDFSSDGKYLAYISRRTSSPGRFEPLAVCILSLDSGNKRELLPSLKHMRFIRWSADGKKFFSYGFDDEGQQALYSIDIQTGETELIVKCKRHEEFIPEMDVFPDGKKIVYVKSIKTKVGEGDTKSMRVLDILNGEEKEIYQKENSGQPKHVAISPDGKWIAFEDYTPPWTLKVIKATGGEPREIVRMKSGENPTSFNWSPDSREIFFTKWSKDEKIIQLWRVAKEDGKSQRIDLSMQGMRELCVHPDGKRVAFSASYRETEVWVMDNLLRLKKVEKIFK
jgi:Tol biopolymer transport system component